MKKILLSLGSIFFAGALLAGGTGAYLADSETSTGNTFATGVIDLLVDNESYVTNTEGELVYSPSTSWHLSSLAGKLFFNFLDLKPGDLGEDTISLHVKNNDAWACMSVDVTATPENGQSEPETLVDTTIGTNEGELQDTLYFTFWADDGDNVYEQGENVFKQGLVKDIFNGDNWALADSSQNIWGTPGPLKAEETKYIGKAWCFGTMMPTPLTQDGYGKTGSNGPLVRGPGFSCDGIPVGNLVQSDGIKADVSFSVAQSRSNKTYRCSGGEDRLGSISGVKFEDTNNNGYKNYSEPGLAGWTIGISSGGATTTTTTNAQGKYSFEGLSPGSYLLCEVQQSGWTQTYPTQKCWQVALGVAQTVVGKDFGNFKSSGNQYCSHGYWKQEQHFDNWNGYSPNQQFSSVFDNAFPGKTLLEVLQQGGGGLDLLGRETVGALLNAGSVNFPYTQAQVIASFNAAYPGSSSTYSALTSKFALPESCPLN